MFWFQEKKVFSDLNQSKPILINPYRSKLIIRKLGFGKKIAKKVAIKGSET